MPSDWESLDDAGPFLATIGPVRSRGEGRDRVLALQTEERHANLAGKVHGGLLATLVDSALGWAVRDQAEAGAVTVSLTSDFLSPVEPGELIETHTEVERLGGRLAFADCSLRAGDREVVRARAVFAVLG